MTEPLSGPASARTKPPQDTVPGVLGALRLVPGRRRVLAIAMATAFFQTLLLLPVAFIIRTVFNRAIPRHDTTSVLLYGLLALACYAGSAACLVASRNLVMPNTKAATSALRRRMLDKLYDLPQVWFDGQHPGNLHHVFVDATDEIDLMLNQLLTLSFPAAVVGVALLAVAAYVDVVLFIALLAVVLVMAMFSRATRGRYRTRIVLHRHAMARYSADAQEAIAALESVRLHGSSDWSRAARNPPIAALEVAGRAAVRAMSVDQAVQGALAAAAGVVVLIVGGIAVASRSMTLGALLGFYAVVALVVRQVSPIVSGAWVVRTGLQALAQVNDFLASDAVADYDGAGRHEFAGTLEAVNVTFAYENGEPLLDRVDFKVGRGEHVALMGPNGAGKSTLVAILLGLRRPDSGRVLADGLPFEDLDLRALRRDIGVVAQKVTLVHGTIGENIAFGRAEPDSAAVRRAAEMAGAAAFIEALPHGYDSVVGEGGRALSGGERQRVAIARALLGEPRFVVLDEPSNNLDLPTSELVLERISGLTHRPALLVVTHDPRIAARADRMIMMRDGRFERDQASLSYDNLESVSMGG
jgi:ABC-type multidrug transport system fused ATPase/permease subunit